MPLSQNVDKIIFVNVLLTYFKQLLKTMYNFKLKKLNYLQYDAEFQTVLRLISYELKIFFIVNCMKKTNEKEILIKCNNFYLEK